MDVKDDEFKVIAIHIRNKDTESVEIIPADARVPVTPEVQFQSDGHAKVLLVKDCLPWALNDQQASSLVIARKQIND